MAIAKESLNTMLGRHTHEGLRHEAHRHHVHVALALAAWVTACATSNGTPLPTTTAVDDSEGEGGEADTSASAGDSSTGTTPETDDSAEVVPVPCASLIDDFEAGGTLILQEDGREGAWYVYNDETEGATQTPPLCEPFLPTEGGFEGSLYAARTSGSGFTVWGAGIGVDLQNAGYDPKTVAECEVDFSNRLTYDASGFTGISFYGKSNTTRTNVKIKFPTTIDTPEGEGGTCTGGDDCNNSRQAIALFEPTWQGYQIAFADLRPAQFGEPFEFDATQLIGLQFEHQQNRDFDFSIDNLCFY